MTGAIDADARAQIVRLVRDFVRNEVEPIAAEYEAEDRYPEHLVSQMRELGLFGITIPVEYGGLGLDYATFATIFEELSRGWMSVSGIIGTHHVMAYMVSEFGAEDQKRRFLPRLASGELRGGLALTEPEAGSDVQSIRTSAVRDGDDYVINGSKMFITNAANGNAFAVMVKTDPDAEPPHRGISCLLVEKPNPGIVVGRKLDKLGYRGIDTAELAFQDCRTPVTNLVGGEEGRGFRHLMGGLETGRINVAARAVGVAQAAFDAALEYAKQRRTFGAPIARHQAIQIKLADMATKIRAARLLTQDAAERKDRGERVDLEAGMAKLFASETCGEVTLEAMRIHGGYGYVKDFPVERYYRDAPLMIIGEGTNEIQKLIIARRAARPVTGAQAKAGGPRGAPAVGRRAHHRRARDERPGPRSRRSRHCSGCSPRSSAGYGYGVSDQAEQLPLIFRAMDSGYLANDFFVNAASEFGPRFYYVHTMAFIGTYVPLPAAFFIIWALTYVALSPGHRLHR